MGFPAIGGRQVLMLATATGQTDHHEKTENEQDDFFHQNKCMDKCNIVANYFFKKESGYLIRDTRFLLLGCNVIFNSYVRLHLQASCNTQEVVYRHQVPP
jgi:hypothetical protein